MKHIHYGWLVCLGCALILFCTSGLAVNAFTIYQPCMLSENGFTNTQASAIVTVRSLTGFLSMFLTGVFYKRISFRTGLTFSGAMTAAGFALFGVARSFSAYCLAAAIVGCGYGLGTMIPAAMLMERWFLQKRTLAIGLCSSVTGLSTLGIPTLLVRLIGRFGLGTTFCIEAAVMAAVTLAGFLLLRDDPGRMGLRPYGSREQEEGSRPARGTAGLRKQDWIVLVPMLLLLGAMTNSGYCHLSVLMTSKGFSMEVAAMAICVSGIALMAGKCLFGLACDRMPVPRCNLLFGVPCIAGLAMLCLVDSSRILLLCGVVLYSTGLALTTVGLTAWAGDWSAPGQYDETTRRFQTGYAAGGLMFSCLPGFLADSFGGSYVPAYLFFCACAVIVLAAAQALYARQGRSPASAASGRGCSLRGDAMPTV
ncbi:MAG: MFS transporter [Mailhella sp.]|nr:MFS transporter [Mailhella sp.]